MNGNKIAQPLLSIAMQLLLYFLRNKYLLHLRTQKKQQVLMRLKPALLSGELKTTDTFSSTIIARIINGKNSHITEISTTAIVAISDEKNGALNSNSTSKKPHTTVVNVLSHGIPSVFTINKKHDTPLISIKLLSLVR